MRIGIYNELTVHTLGGAEYAVATLAEDLKRGNQVEVVNHCPTMTVEELAEFSGADLDGVRMRYVPFSRRAYASGRNPWRRYRQERDWQADLSSPYDLFINFAHWIPPFCHARHGVLIVLFPLFIPPDTFVGEPSAPPQRRSIRKWLRNRYYRWQWRDRMDTYGVKLAISHFTQSWTRRWWNISCPVLYPPVGTAVASVEKSKSILSIGRFTPSYAMDSKNQLELMMVFANLCDARRAGWRFTCAGRVSDVTVDQKYFEAVRSLGETCGAEAFANLPRAEVDGLLERAAIFWHATGLGTNSDKEPYVAEHFGISTGEAMASGCVPVVINSGGLRELVQHGLNGFVWDDLRELKELTMLLIGDERLRRQMSEAARLRGQEFGRERFQKGMREHIRRAITNFDLAQAAA
jgi:glycosyltransferase involved in cell wall biosynthesis